MLSENVIELFDELGFTINIDNNEKYIIIDKNTNLPMNVTKENGKIFAENELGFLHFGFNCPIADPERAKNNYINVLGNLTIQHKTDESLLRIGCYGAGLLINYHNVIKENFETKIKSYSLLINNNGTLTINITNDPMAYVVWNRHDLLTNINETDILDIFDDEKVLAIIKYYSNIYPEMLEGVVELTQSIVSKTQEKPLTRKLIK